MSAVLKNSPETPVAGVPAAGLVYDPKNLHPMDEEDRKHDDTSEGIDWDEIIATTQADCEAGRCKRFKSADYPTEEALIEAMFRCTDEELGRKRG